MWRPRWKSRYPQSWRPARHGYYFHTFTRLEHERLDRDTLGKLEDKEYSLKFLVGRIESIHRSRKVIYDSQTSMDKAYEEALISESPLKAHLFVSSFWRNQTIRLPRFYLFRDLPVLESLLSVLSNPWYTPASLEIGAHTPGKLF